MWPSFNKKNSFWHKTPTVDGMCVCVCVCEWQKGTDRMQSWGEVIIWMSSAELSSSSAGSDVFLSIWTEMAPWNDLVCPVGVIFSPAAPNTACVHRSGTRSAVSSYLRRKSSQSPLSVMKPERTREVKLRCVTERFNASVLLRLTSKWAFCRF